jgi:hypothetical protein
MERLADPRTYVCALEQSQEPSGFTLDPVYYSYCENTSTVLKPDVEAPITTPDKCFAQRGRKSTKHICKCGPDCQCGPFCNC